MLYIPITNPVLWNSQHDGLYFI